MSIGILIAIIGTFGIGFGDFFAGLSSRKINAKNTLLFIFFAQSIVAFIYWLIFKHSITSNPLAIITILIAGIFQASGLILFYKAMSMEKISLVSPIFSTYAVLTILFGVLVLHDHLSSLKVVSIVLVFLGTIFASSDYSFRQQSTSFSKGILIALLGTILFAVDFLLMTLVFKFSDYYFANFLYSFSTFLTALVINRQSLTKLTRVKHKSLPLLVGFLYASSNIVWAISLTKLPSSIFGAISATFPTVTVIASFIFLKERLARVQLFGVIAILTGIILLGIN